jgi:hypothetical protein
MFLVALPLTECSKEEQQSVIQFLWPRDVKTSDICGRMVVQYGNNHISHWL